MNIYSTESQKRQFPEKNNQTTIKKKLVLTIDCVVHQEVI